MLNTEHHEKLIASLVAVLNYRRGSDPSSIKHLIRSHEKLGIGPTQLHNFRESFMETLQHCFDKVPHDPKAPDFIDFVDIDDAWRKLFEPVLDELARELEVDGWPLRETAGFITPG